MKLLETKSQRDSKAKSTDGILIVQFFYVYVTGSVAFDSRFQYGMSYAEHQLSTFLCEVDLKSPYFATHSQRSFFFISQNDFYITQFMS